LAPFFGSGGASSVNQDRTVRLTDPEALLSTVMLQGAPELTSVAHDARERMVRVAASLAKR